VVETSKAEAEISKIEMAKVDVINGKINKRTVIHKVRAEVVVEDSVTKILHKIKTTKTMSVVKMTCLSHKLLKISRIVLDSILNTSKVKNGNMIASVGHLSKKRNQKLLKASSSHILNKMTTTEKKNSQTKSRNSFKIANLRTETKSNL
jgi:hypothetical protein